MDKNFPVRCGLRRFGPLLQGNWCLFRIPVILFITRGSIWVRIAWWKKSCSRLKAMKQREWWENMERNTYLPGHILNNLSLPIRPYFLIARKGYTSITELPSQSPTYRCMTHLGISRYKLQHVLKIPKWTHHSHNSMLALNTAFLSVDLITAVILPWSKRLNSFRRLYMSRKLANFEILSVSMNCAANHDTFSKRYLCKDPDNSKHSQWSAFRKPYQACE